MKLRFSHFLALFTLIFLWSAPAHAETSAPLIFQMADGRFFNPQSGLISANRDELIGLLGAASGTAVVSNASVTNETTTSLNGIDQPVQPSLKEAILRGRQLLNERLAAENAAQKKIPTVSNQNVWVDVTVAVWNPTTDAIRMITLQKNGAKIRAASEDQITVHFSNGVNTQFALANAAQNVVVAVEYPIFKQVTVKKTKIYELHDVVYTPFSDQLRTPEIIQWGEASLDGVIAGVYDQLRQQGIRSRAFPDRLLADVIDPNVAKSIILIEHLSPQSLLNGDPHPAEESVYAVYAVNQAQAYAYARSSANAMGLVQFIPSTYALMVKRADLGLIADFETGMSTPSNAIRAEVAYLDAELASLPLSVRDLYAADPNRVYEYLAASYNGGSGRVRKAIAVFGDKWSSASQAEIEAQRAVRQKVLGTITSLKAQIKKSTDAKETKSLKAQLATAQKKNNDLIDLIESMKPAVLRAETADYVKKFRVVMNLLNPPSIVTAATVATSL